MSRANGSERTRTVGLIQARMGSSRLPGKMLLPLGGSHVVERIVERARLADSLDSVVVATSEAKQDDLLARRAERVADDVYRGSESDVLKRLRDAVKATRADVAVRICGDTPLLSPDVVDVVVERLHAAEADYVSTLQPRTFPRGVDVEAFTVDSFGNVADRATEPRHREHVTVYYREQADIFDVENVTSDEVFDAPDLVDRSDLRLTLDEADDYELVERIYDEVEFEDVPSLPAAIRYIDENDLADVNATVEQRTPEETE